MLPRVGKSCMRCTWCMLTFWLKNHAHICCVAISINWEVKSLKWGKMRYADFEEYHIHNFEDILHLTKSAFRHFWTFSNPVDHDPCHSYDNLYCEVSQLPVCIKRPLPMVSDLVIKWHHYWPLCDSIAITGQYLSRAGTWRGWSVQNQFRI